MNCAKCGVQLAWVMGPDKCDGCRAPIVSSMDDVIAAFKAAEPVAGAVRRMSDQAQETGRWAERARMVRGIEKLTRYRHPRGEVVLIADLIALIESGMTEAPKPSAPEEDDHA